MEERRQYQGFGQQQYAGAPRSPELALMGELGPPSRLSTGLLPPLLTTHDLHDGRQVPPWQHRHEWPAQYQQQTHHVHSQQGQQTDRPCGPGNYPYPFPAMQPPPPPLALPDAPTRPSPYFPLTPHNALLPPLPAEIMDITRDHVARLDFPLHPACSSADPPRTPHRQQRTVLPTGSDQTTPKQYRQPGPQPQSQNRFRSATAPTIWCNTSSALEVDGGAPVTGVTSAGSLQSARPGTEVRLSASFGDARTDDYSFTAATAHNGISAADNTLCEAVTCPARLTADRSAALAPGLIITTRPSNASPIPAASLPRLSLGLAWAALHPCGCKLCRECITDVVTSRNKEDGSFRCIRCGSLAFEFAGFDDLRDQAQSSAPRPNAGSATPQEALRGAFPHFTSAQQRSASSSHIVAANSEVAIMKEKCETTVERQPPLGGPVQRQRVRSSSFSQAHPPGAASRRPVVSSLPNSIPTTPSVSQPLRFPRGVNQHSELAFVPQVRTGLSLEFMQGLPGHSDGEAQSSPSAENRHQVVTFLHGLPGYRTDSDASPGSLTQASSPVAAYSPQTPLQSYDRDIGALKPHPDLDSPEHSLSRVSVQDRPPPPFDLHKLFQRIGENEEHDARSTTDTTGNCCLTAESRCSGAPPTVPTGHTVLAQSSEEPLSRVATAYASLPSSGTVADVFTKSRLPIAHVSPLQYLHQLHSSSGRKSLPQSPSSPQFLETVRRVESDMGVKSRSSTPRLYGGATLQNSGGGEIATSANNQSVFQGRGAIPRQSPVVIERELMTRLPRGVSQDNLRNISKSRHERPSDMLHLRHAQDLFEPASMTDPWTGIVRPAGKADAPDRVSDTISRHAVDQGAVLPSLWPVVRLDGVHHSSTVDGIASSLPPGVLPPLRDAPLPIHILCNIRNGRTDKRIYIECASPAAAERLIEGVTSGKVTLKGRYPIKAVRSSQRELAAVLFDLPYSPGEPPLMDVIEFDTKLFSHAHLMQFLLVLKGQRCLESSSPIFPRERPFTQLASLLLKLPYHTGIVDAEQVNDLYHCLTSKYLVSQYLKR